MLFVLREKLPIYLKKLTLPSPCLKFSYLSIRSISCYKNSLQVKVTFSHSCLILFHNISCQNQFLSDYYLLIELVRQIWQEILETKFGKLVDQLHKSQSHSHVCIFNFLLKLCKMHDRRDFCAKTLLHISPNNLPYLIINGDVETCLF